MCVSYGTSSSILHRAKDYCKISPALGFLLSLFPYISLPPTSSFYSFPCVSHSLLPSLCFSLSVFLSLFMLVCVCMPALRYILVYCTLVKDMMTSWLALDLASGSRYGRSAMAIAESSSAECIICRCNSYKQVSNWKLTTFFQVINSLSQAFLMGTFKMCLPDNFLDGFPPSCPRYLSPYWVFGKSFHFS